jgi:hypothetical protein
VSVVILGVLAIALATSLWFATRIARPRLNVAEAERQLKDFNIAALSRLLSQEEKAFLVSRLGQSCFAKIQRRRMRVALLYLSDLSAILNALHLAEASELRLLIAKARLTAMWAWLFPISALPNLDLQQSLQRLKNVNYAFQA